MDPKASRLHRPDTVAAPAVSSALDEDAPTAAATAVSPVGSELTSQPARASRDKARGRVVDAGGDLISDARRPVRLTSPASH